MRIYASSSWHKCTKIADCSVWGITPLGISSIKYWLSKINYLNVFFCMCKQTFSHEVTQSPVVCHLMSLYCVTVVLPMTKWEDFLYIMQFFLTCARLSLTIVNIYHCGVMFWKLLLLILILLVSLILTRLPSCVNLCVNRICFLEFNDKDLEKNENLQLRSLSDRTYHL